MIWTISHPHLNIPGARLRASPHAQGWDRLVVTGAGFKISVLGSENSH
jgi:hypothetical protein